MFRGDRLRVMQVVEQRVMLQAQGLTGIWGMLPQTNPSTMSSSVVLMAKHSAYDSDVLYEVPTHDTYQDNNVIDQSVQEMQYSEQPVFFDDSNIDITSDSNVISYNQYLKENACEIVQDTKSSKQQDSMIMFVIEEMSNQVAKCNAVN
ncbi:hypothetical protein Tco_0671143 [Tanacetum coccineum]